MPDQTQLFSPLQSLSSNTRNYGDLCIKMDVTAFWELLRESPGLALGPRPWPKALLPARHGERKGSPVEPKRTSPEGWVARGSGGSWPARAPRDPIRSHRTGEKTNPLVPRLPGRPPPYPLPSSTGRWNAQPTVAAALGRHTWASLETEWARNLQKEKRGTLDVLHLARWRSLSSLHLGAPGKWGSLGVGSFTEPHPSHLETGEKPGSRGRYEERSLCLVVPSARNHRGNSPTLPPWERDGEPRCGEDALPRDLRRQGAGALSGHLQVLVGWNSKAFLTKSLQLLLEHLEMRISVPPKAACSLYGCL
ncbi:uncharacterized protein [Notamacropus eugenii]|uniref:uncharacterized protein n=1 Tax=Notamacropus eugenii TaxID=9315 RepID=UPI003B683061